MNAITLAPDLEKHAEKWARRSGQSLDALVAKALERLLEDLEDYAAAEEALKDYDPSTNVSLEDVMRRFDLED